ncbi:sensor histidine kinase [Bartonella sp. HY038]|uniref:sensor histidine kinase n=1 Tax=Bartonella sp. HY038 TaxID=2759660 RepID=UPI0015FB2DE2|nr:sensor histidine kinase [Bartonella sp. HY038]
MRIFKHFNSLKLRFLGVLICIVIVVTACICFFTWQFAFVTSKQAFDRILTNAAIQIAENIYTQGKVITLDPPAAALGSLSRNDLVFYKVVDARGITVAGSADLPRAGTLDDIQKSVVLKDGQFDNMAIRIASIGKRLTIDGIPQWAEITVGQTTHERDELASSMATKAFIIIFIMSFLMICMSYLAISYALSPLTKIGNEIQNRLPEDMSAIKFDLPIEVKPFTQALNDFFQRLSKRMARMQRFIADAAHQIKTPLTSLDAHAEMLLRKNTSPELQTDLREMRVKIKALSRLCHQMLGRAMVTHRSQNQSFSECDLVALCKTTLVQTVPLTLEREVATAVYHHGFKQLKILCDPITLCEAISNLIDNALKHGAHTRLILTIGSDEEGAWIRVSDDGHGIFEGDYERLCLPFQKGGDHFGNTGLGLTIVRDVVEAHHGRLQFSSNDGMFHVAINGLKLAS